MKQGPYHGRRGKLHRHGRPSPRPSNQKPSRRVRFRDKLRERAEP